MQPFEEQKWRDKWGPKYLYDCRYEVPQDVILLEKISFRDWHVDLLDKPDDEGGISVDILGVDVFDDELHESEEGQDICIILKKSRGNVFVEADQFDGKLGVVADECC